MAVKKVPQFAADEIKEAVDSMKPNKAPRPNVILPEAIKGVVKVARE